MDIGIISFLASIDGRSAVFIQGDRLRDAVVKVSAAAIATLSLLWHLPILEIRWSSVWEILFWRKVQY